VPPGAGQRGGGAPPPAGPGTSGAGSGAVPKPSVVELGGGEGQLAAAVLGYWQRERLDWRGKVCYRIVEVGARLRERQAAAVDEARAAGWDLGWGADLEEASAGSRPVVIVGNEFLDAIPVHAVDVSGERLREAYVEVAGTGLGQSLGEISTDAATEVLVLFGTLDPRLLRPLTEDGILEVFPGLGTLMARAAAVMPSGSLVNIDYGEWFPGVMTPEEGERAGLETLRKRRRSVRGYFKQQMVHDPLARAGRQDLTADVDFAAVDLNGRREGFETVLFTTMARFLRGGGAEDELRFLRGGAAPCASAAGGVPPASLRAVDTGGPAALDPIEADHQATVLENLLDEQDLGVAFKVMLQVRD
jgi:SAM-dependent MidA family methyltransferase